MTELVVGLDLGTSSCKGVVFTSEGAEIARWTSQPYPRHSPAPGRVELDPEDVWLAVLDVLHGLVKELEAQGRIAVVCLAAQSGSTLLLDDGNQPVCPLITWMDGRSESVVNSWKDRGLEEEIKQASGWSLYPGLPLPTLAWLSQETDYLNQAAHFVSANDWIVSRLTGELVTNPSNAGGTQLVEISTGDWSEKLSALAGLESVQHSRLEPSGAVIGEILEDVCQQTGLESGTVLVNGGHDQVCTALGLGIVDPGKMLLACGTAWVITSISPVPNDPALPAALDLNFHAVPQRWTVSQSLGGLGASLEWWMDQAWFGSREERYGRLDRELDGTRPGGDLVFAPLTGGHSDPATTRPGGFAGLRLDHTKADLARAILESAGYELRWAVDALAGSPVEGRELFMVGGAASSPHWPGILSQITGLPIQVPEYDNWPAVGAAILAGIGAGVFPDPESGIQTFQRGSRRIEPDPELAELYRDGFERYRRLTGLLQELN